VYQRDLQTDALTLVSVNRDGNGNNLDCSSFNASGDGQLVAFASLDGNLVAGDLNNAYDVFVRNLADGTTELISQALPEPTPATPLAISSVQPGAISADGRYLAFTSLAANLVSNDSNATHDVFVRDLVNGTNVLVSVNTNGTSGNDVSQFPVLSADGRFVAFVSRATDLTPNVTNSTRKVYLRDLEQNTTILVSVNTNGFGSSGNAFNPFVSADGQWVVYSSTALDMDWRDTSPGRMCSHSIVPLEAICS
jgi:Tol biopolymer transport system component